MHCPLYHKVCLVYFILIQVDIDYFGCYRLSSQHFLFQLLVDVKEEESKHLQEEVSEARERMEEESRRLQEEVLEARAKMEQNEAELRKELEIIQVCIF